MTKQHATLVLVAALATTAGGSASAETLQLGHITFTTAIPAVRKPLPLFRLSRTAAPAALIRALAGTKPHVAIEGARLVARDAHGTLQAFADARSGEAQLFPDFRSTGAPAQTAAIEGVAAGMFARTDVIPKDATTIRLGDPQPVFSSSAVHASDGSTHAAGAPQVLFTYVPAIRYAAGLQVFGNGSQATVGVGNDGSIRALVRRWQAASVAGTVAPSVSPRQIREAIDAQLGHVATSDVAISVDRIVPAYYDGDARYLQPVYAFDATLHALGQHAADEHVRGYVPYGELSERLPAIGENAGPPPSAPQPSGSDPLVTQITVAQYANRDGTMQDQANAYMSGFDSVTPGVYGPPINRTQWFWAIPSLMLADANSYANAANVTYTMPHGNWWWNSTLGHNNDPWQVQKIGTGGNPGYGAAAGGVLATWIIDSCEVIPSYYDLQYTTGNGNNAYNNWWPVFQGLHRAMGFRTEMLLGEDSMNYEIAQLMAEGATPASSMSNSVAAVSFGTYTDSHLKLKVHYDRVSVMVDPRNDGETIYDIAGQTASPSLQNIWMGN